MATAALTSDHVNYLIWRYLQEAGYGHSAAKLQQFWLREKDPQSLPFAKNINQHALISLVQKGLKYNQIEQNYSKSSIAEGISAASAYFGPENGRTSTPDQRPQQRESSAIDQQPSSPRKTNRDNAVNGLSRLSIGPHPSEPAPKRARRSNGTDGAGADAMQLDENGFDLEKRDIRDSASPGGYSATGDGQVNGMDLDADDERMQDHKPPMARTNGQSRAIQSDKVEDLTATTTMLTLPDRDNIMHTTWNPHKPSVLATGGDALCRLWHITKEARIAEPFQKQYHDLLLPGDGSLVTSMAWNPDGTLLAVAAKADASEMTGTVSTWTDDGKALDDLTTGQEMVIKLQWNASGSLLFGITSSGDGTSSIIVWDVETSQALPPVQCDKVITDATWTGTSAITVCGNGVIGRWDINPHSEIVWAHKLNEQITEGRWTQIICNPRTDMITIFDEENARVMALDANGVLRASGQFHKEAITAIAFKPYLNSPQASPLLATTSLDGTIKYWDTTTLLRLHHLDFGQDLPPLALSFSPDGALLAAASHNKVLVWETKGGNLPIASWKGELGKPFKPALSNGHSADKDSGIGDDATEDGMNEPNVSLHWEADGRRLALGSGNQIALITVKP